MTLDSPLYCKEIKPVNPKGNQPWIFTGRTDAEAEAPKLWPPDAKSWLIRKDPDARKDWRQEKEMTEDEMVGWHHWIHWHEFEQALELVMDRKAWRAPVPEVSKGQTQLSDWTELNWRNWPVFWCFVLFVCLFLIHLLWVQHSCLNVPQKKKIQCSLLYFNFYFTMEQKGI